jgi:hypothetical protein
VPDLFLAPLNGLRSRLIQFLQLLCKRHAMTKTLVAPMHRKEAEGKLFGARQRLRHLVDMYDNGQWRRFYKEDVFAEMVRQAREGVDHWADVLCGYDRD